MTLALYQLNNQAQMSQVFSLPFHTPKGDAGAEFTKIRSNVASVPLPILFIFE